MASGLIPDGVLKLSELNLEDLVKKYLDLRPQLAEMEPEIIKMHRS
jgi:hypothetical protein